MIVLCFWMFVNICADKLDVLYINHRRNPPTLYATSNKCFCTASSLVRATALITALRVTAQISSTCLLRVNFSVNPNNKRVAGVRLRISSPEITLRTSSRVVMGFFLWVSGVSEKINVGPARDD